MSEKINLNTIPYNIDYSEQKGYYKVLFQPGVSVQVRELNNLQSMFQKQIERFGDNIMVRGTIIDGCNFVHYNPAPYIKINDIQTDGVTAAVPSSYVNHHLFSSSSGVKAMIQSYADGFESSDPDIKTLYIDYINSGTDSATHAYVAGESLEVYDYQRSVHNFTITNGGVSFSNSDTVIVSSALVVNVVTGTFAALDYINDGGTANIQIIAIDSTTLAATGQEIWQVAPRAIDLEPAATTSTAWTIANNAAIADSGATATGTVERIVGSSLEAIVRTNAVGAVLTITATNRGSGYTTVPLIRIKSDTNTTGIAALDVAAKNFLAKVVVSSAAASVGNGYAFGVTAGVIYQKGYFQKVDPQRITVEKYNQLPNAVSIGFGTREEIITSSLDSSLKDNATGEPNFAAPGADRLKLTPELKVLAANAAVLDTEFFTLVEFSNGRPFRQNKTTQYNKINDEMARRTKDESGDYVIDKFIMSTSSPATASQEANLYTLQIDPGSAYIDGYRVRTDDTYSADVLRTTETRVGAQHVSLNYGNYVVLNEVGGVFQFSTGDTITLYDTATSWVSNTDHVELGNITPVGNIIGTARIRSMVPRNNISPESSQIGAADAEYQLYLFDINMNAGRSFSDARGVYNNGLNYEAIGDVVTITIGTSNTQVAELADHQRRKMMFYSGVQSIHNANAITYTYRTIDEAESFSAASLLTKSLTGTPDEFYKTTGAMSNAELLKMYVVPVGGDIVSIDQHPGTVSLSTGSNTLTGTGTAYTDEFVAGDYVRIYQSAAAAFHTSRIDKIINSTSLELDKVGDYTNAVAKLQRVFPKYMPMPFGSREGMTGSIDGAGEVLSLTIAYENANAFNLLGGLAVDTAIATNVKRTAAARKTKTPQRTKYVKLVMSNNAGGVSGPWSLGVPDVFRLRGVYHSKSTTVTTSSNAVLNQLYVDHNQNLDYYGLSYLYLKPRHNLTMASGDSILVEFDYFTESGTGGFHDAISYVSANTTLRVNTDSQPLSGIVTNVHSFEIPTMVADDGIEYDLINQFDFRPYVNTTATPHATPASAPINPNTVIGFGDTSNPANDKKFPLPDSIMSATVSQFLARIDSVFIDRSGTFSIVSGKPGSNTLNAAPPMTLMVVSSYLTSMFHHIQTVLFVNQHSSKRS